jgi:hypothetical protein
MISQVTEQISNMFTLDHLAYFTAGVTAAWAWQAAKAWIKHRHVRINFRPIIIMASVIVLGFITISTHRASQCITEFNRVLTVRSMISDQDQEISLLQRKLIYDWMHQLIFPPPEVAKLEPNDPVRQQWAVGVTIDTDRQFARSLTRQSNNEMERAKNPLPTATCK